jgi:hypothetical protein
MDDTAHDDAFSPGNHILQDRGATRIEHAILGTSCHPCRRGDSGCHRLQRGSLFDPGGQTGYNGYTRRIYQLA